MSQMIFRRYEYKYLLTRQQHRAILDILQEHMTLDQYGRSTISNFYYDTPSFLLIRTSLEHPCYKEKLRLRTYGSDSTHAFLELKKKYDGIVYKRRISLPLQNALDCMACRTPFPDSQIGHELQAAVNRYPRLRPAVFLSYEREAYYDPDGSDFRVTFDENIRCRWDSQTMAHPEWGIPVLPPDTVLMELKLSQSIPLWMAQALSRLNIQKSSFSKYGKAYRDMLAGQYGEGQRQVG